VDAYLDRDANDAPDLPRPAGSPHHVFEPPADLSQSPASYGDAAAVNLFYWCNWFHDRLYELGFDEAAGNYQKDNFGRGGAGGDAVLADAQDGGGFNNANFTPAEDGVPGRVQMYVFDGVPLGRDGSFDSDVVLHELTHGVTMRLVGAGLALFNDQSAGLGEGWSDFYALALTAPPEADLDGAYPAGGYASYGYRGLMENFYFGIRRYPYSTDLSKNPLTYRDIDPALAVPHTTRAHESHLSLRPDARGRGASFGEVWCVALWEARANLIRKYGYDTGQRLILQLVTDGLKLTPSEPNFVQARDAILQADLVNDGGQNLNELWSAFAKRGLGLAAQAPPSWLTGGVTESFAMPDTMQVSPVSSLQFSGPPGGPFAPDCRSFLVYNGNTNSLEWSVNGTADWLILGPEAESIPPQAGRELFVCPEVTAAALPPGLHTTSLAFSNLNTGWVVTRQVQIHVVDVATMPFSENFEARELARSGPAPAAGRPSRS
jgi:hypothetical protein